jgi:hypothetical protein
MRGSNKANPQVVTAREGAREGVRHLFAALVCFPCTIRPPTCVVTKCGKLSSGKKEPDPGTLNTYVEETAIEDSYTWEDAQGYAAANLYTRITRAYSRLRKGELVKGEYYRDENKPEVYQYDGSKLAYQSSLPKRAAVILVPAGMLGKHAARSLPASQ